MDNEELLQRFLFGDLSASERAEVEDRFLANDDFFQELLLGEDDLIDAYVRAELPAAERALFERCCLSTQSGRERVEFAQALFDSVSGQDAAAVVAMMRAPGRTGSPSWWRALFDALARRRPALGFALASVLLVCALGGLWFLTDRARHNTPQPEQARQISPLPTSESTANTPAAQEPLNQAKVTPPPAPARETQKKPAPTSPVIATFTLLPGAVRSEGNSNIFALLRGASEVRLRLVLEGEEYRQYRATLSTAEGRKFWSRVVAKGTANKSASLTLSLPAALLKNDDYVLGLSGANANGEWESVSDYSFRIVKQ